MSGARFTSFLVKVASRCNLDCDYCYVYHHADQSWRQLPRLLGADDQQAFARRLAEYAKDEGLTRAAIIFHGGEPLLAGAEALASFAALLRQSVGDSVRLDFGLQTNGLLLTEHVLDVLDSARINVSLSLDGPRQANDRHRTTRRGRSSFDRVLQSLETLKRRPNSFAGVIAVIDPAIPPAVTLDFFAGHHPPKLDFLLPDSHHDRPPPGREADPSLYERWLIQAFDLWFDQYPELPVRTFEALLDAAAGLPSGTDAFGLGDVSLVSIETDGSYHDLDVLKVTSDGATRLGGSVLDRSIRDVANSPEIEAHRRLLSRGGLSAECRQCAIIDICGGGSVPHRFGKGSFDHPTVYCREMKALVGHVRTRLAESLARPAREPEVRTDIRLDLFEQAESARAIVADLWTSAWTDTRARLGRLIAELPPSIAPVISAIYESLAPAEQQALAERPGVTAWMNAFSARHEGRVLYDVDGRPLEASLDDLRDMLVQPPRGGLEIGAMDPWLRLPFGDSILFEPLQVAAPASRLVEEALAIIGEWRPALHSELLTICKTVQFVRDPGAHPEKIVSFSDNAVPGALYVSVVQGDRLIDPYDLADSLIHEHRHQKLYLLERRCLLAEPGESVVSPWREDLRPPSGLLHAAFVFVELQRFWEHVLETGPASLSRRASSQLADTRYNLAQAFDTLRTCPLTPAGRELAHVLEGARLAEPVAA